MQAGKGRVEGVDELDPGVGVTSGLGEVWGGGVAAQTALDEEGLGAVPEEVVEDQLVYVETGGGGFHGAGHWEGGRERV